MKKIYDFIDPFVNLHLYGVNEPFKYEFNPLYQMSEEQIATLNRTNADTHAIYIDRGVVTDAAVLSELQKDGMYADYDPEKFTGFDV